MHVQMYLCLWKKSLKIAHLNCLSLTKQIDELILTVHDLDLNVLTLSGTHLSDNFDDADIFILVIHYSGVIVTAMVVV